jgi:hypothetical protein
MTFRIFQAEMSDHYIKRYSPTKRVKGYAIQAHTTDKVFSQSLDIQSHTTRLPQQIDPAPASNLVPLKNKAERPRLTSKHDFQNTSPKIADMQPSGLNAVPEWRRLREMNTVEGCAFPCTASAAVPAPLGLCNVLLPYWIPVRYDLTVPSLRCGTCKKVTVHKQSGALLPSTLSQTTSQSIH